MKKLLILLLLALPLATRAQKLALQTDLLWDVAMFPNLGAEITTGERTTVGIALMGAYKPYGMDTKMLVAQPEWRYYFSGRPMNKYFFGIGGIAGFYDVTSGDKVYDGTCYGAGLTVGYVHKFGPRLNLDLHAGFGLVAYSRKEYYMGDAYDRDYTIDGDNKTNASGYYLIPTRIGVSLTYILW